MNDPTNYDADAARLIDLDEDALDCALDAATEAHAAGDEEQAQLIAAIKVYLWKIGERK